MIFIKNGEIAEQGTHEELMAKKVDLCEWRDPTPSIFFFSNIRVACLQAWPHLTPRGMLIKGTAREADLVGKYQKVLCKFPFWTESTSLSPDEEEAAVQKDQKDESSGNGEVSFCCETN